MANAFGFEIRRKGFRTTLGEVCAHVSKLGFKPRTVIDVGVAYGTFELYEKFPGADFLLIEPLQEYENVLKDIAAAGEKSGSVTLNVHSDLSGSSMLKEAEGSQTDGIPRKVPVVTIDNLCRQKNLKGPFLIKVDVQGAELKVLGGAKKTLKDSELVVLEVSLFQFFVGGPQLYDVVSYMKKQGFVVYAIFGGHLRPFDGALAQIDMAFVKEKGQFREHHFYATEEQRRYI